MSEPTLQPTHASLLRFLEVAPAAIALLIEPEHTFAYANAQYAKLVGNRPLIGLTVREALPEIAEQGFYELLDGVYASGEPFFGTELPVVLRGQDRPVYMNFVYQAMRDENGRIGGIAVHATEVTELVLSREREREAREAAEQQRVHFQLLFDAMPQLGWTAQANGFIDFYNRGWYAYTGTTYEEMQGWGWRTVHDEGLLDAVVARWQHSIDTGEPFEMEFPLRRHDGVFRWFLTRVNPVRDSEGRIIRWVGVNTDIDDSRAARALAEALVEQTQETERVIEALRAERDEALQRARRA